MDLDWKFPDLPTIETERLIMRKLTPGDAYDVFDYASDPLVARYVGWDAHGSVDDSRAFIQFSQEGYELPRGGPWGLVLKSEQKLIGTCGIFDWKPNHRRAEIGYAIGRRYWGNGYTAEATREMIRFGFEQMNLHRIHAICDLPNTASARVMEKVGMTYEGILRDWLFAKGKFAPVKMYSILRVEWDELQRMG